MDTLTWLQNKEGPFSVSEGVKIYIGGKHEKAFETQNNCGDIMPWHDNAECGIFPGTGRKQQRRDIE